MAGEPIAWTPVWRGTIAGIRVAVSENGEMAIDAHPDDYEATYDALGPLAQLLAHARMVHMIAFADAVATWPNARASEALSEHWRAIVDAPRDA